MFRSALIMFSFCLLFFKAHGEQYCLSDLKLILDEDGGTDDVMAIFIAILYEKYYDGPTLVGITTSHGNVDEYQTFLNTQRTLSIANRTDIPIFRGANKSLIENYPSDHFFGYDGLGDTDYARNFVPIEAQIQPAAIALIEMSKKYEGKLVVIAIGALTNIALAIRLDPGFLGRLAQLYVGAGHIANGDEFIYPEFNVMSDVEAYRITTEAATPSIVTVLPSSQTSIYLNITKKWRQEVLGILNTSFIRALNQFERVAYTKFDTWHRLDPAVVSMFVNQGLVNVTQYANNTVALCGDQRGVTTFDFQYREPNVNVIISMFKDAYQKFLIKIFSAQLAEN